MQHYKTSDPRGGRSDSDTDYATPRDDRFYTPRVSARLGGSSSDSEWATPRSGVYLSDEGEFSSPRPHEQMVQQPYYHGHYDPGHHYPTASKEPTMVYPPQSEAKWSVPPGYAEAKAHPYSHLPPQSYHPGYQQGAPHYPTMSPVGVPTHAHPAYPSAYEGGGVDGYYTQPVGYSQARMAQELPPRIAPPMREYAPPPQHYHHPPHQAPYGAYEGYQAEDKEAAADYGDYYGDGALWQDREAVDAYYRQSYPRGEPHAASKETSSDPPPSSNDALDRAVDDIFSCARHNRVDDVERLLDMGVPVNVRDKFGNTILTISCQNGNKRVTKAALRRGADINAQNYKGNTPLHFCFTYGYGDTLGQYMISKGADPSIRNEAGLSCYDGLGH